MPVRLSKPGKMAHPLDPDINPWDQQPGETPAAYAEFLTFRDSDDRKVAPAGMETSKASQRKRWSAAWSWSVRTKAWDRFLAAEEAEELVRYRAQMNKRHRTVATFAQTKFVEWLRSQSAQDVAKWRPADAVRVWEVATRIEREASGANLPHDLPGELEGLEVSAGAVDGPKTLGDMLQVDPLVERELARAVHQAMRDRL